MDTDEELKVWCGNLSAQVDEELLYELFLQVGPLKEVKIPVDKTGKNQNYRYGFVTFKHKASVQYAVNLLHDTKLFEKRIIVRNKGVNASPTNRQDFQVAAPPMAFPNHNMQPLPLMGSPLFTYANDNMQMKSQPNRHMHQRNAPYLHRHQNNYNNRHYNDRPYYNDRNRHRF